MDPRSSTTIHSEGSVGLPPLRCFPLQIPPKLIFLGIDDPRDPYNSGARAQSFVPALNETWDYTRDQIRGVNLGGWLVLEPFIVPALFEKYQNVTGNPDVPGGRAVDEWTLSVAMTNDTSEGGGLNQLEDHYRTFITERDFAQIAGAGLNWIRYVHFYSLVGVHSSDKFKAAFRSRTGLSKPGQGNHSSRKLHGSMLF